MNREQFSGKWHELKGKVREKWGKLTHDEVEQINGKMEQLSGHLQKKYGWAKEKADQEINQWCSSYEHGKSPGKDNMHMGPKTHNEGHTGGKREENYGRSEDRKGDMNRGGQHMNEGKQPNSMNDKKKMHGPEEYKEKKRKAG